MRLHYLLNAEDAELEAGPPGIVCGTTSPRHAQISGISIHDEEEG